MFILFWKFENFDWIRLRNPRLLLRLNKIVSKERAIAFELTIGKHKQTDVERFISLTATKIRNGYFTDDAPVIILGNGPMNRSRRIWNLVAKFITPATPKQNMIEQFFGAIKGHFARFRTLEALNESSNSNSILCRTSLQAICIAVYQDMAPANFCSWMNLVESS